jgi:hypothetical protein
MRPKLVDMNGDGIPEVVVSDNAFYHWPIGSDGDPMPEVILRWRQDKDRPANDLMLKAAPTSAELSRLAREIRESLERNLERGEPPPGIWTDTLALLYSGHEKLGWQFLEEAWRPGFPGADGIE